MGMSEGQKKRKYGDAAVGGTGRRGSARAESRSSGPRASAGAPSGPGPRGLDPARRVPLAPGTYRHEDLRAEPGKRSSAGVLVGVLTAVALLLFVYVHVLVLHALGGHFGVVLPELAPWRLGRPELAETAARLGADGLADYRYVHRSSGLLQPLLLAGAWCALIAVAGLPRRNRRLLWAVPVVYAVVALVGNAVLGAALADPGSGPAVWASVLLLARWVLVAGLVLEAAWLFLRLVRSKADAFSRGELPEQQEARRRSGR